MITQREKEILELQDKLDNLEYDLNELIKAEEHWEKELEYALFVEDAEYIQECRDMLRETRDEISILLDDRDVIVEKLYELGAITKYDRDMLTGNIFDEPIFEDELDDEEDDLLAVDEELVL